MKVSAWWKFLLVCAVLVLNGNIAATIQLFGDDDLGTRVGCTTCKTPTATDPNPQCRDCCNDTVSTVWKGNSIACASAEHDSCTNIGGSFYSRVQQNDKVR